MTRDKANEVLALWREGAETYSKRVINQALYACGDLGQPQLARKEAAWTPQPESILGPPVVTWRNARAGGNSDFLSAEAA
jgi:hypothetical protein